MSDGNDVNVVATWTNQDSIYSIIEDEGKYQIVHTKGTELEFVSPPFAALARAGGE